MLAKILLIGGYVSFSEGPTLKRKPTPPKNGRRASEEDKAETEEEQELVTVTKVVEEVISGFSILSHMADIYRVGECHAVV